MEYSETQDPNTIGGVPTHETAAQPLSSEIQPLSSEDADRILTDILGSQRFVSTEEVENAVEELNNQEYATYSEPETSEETQNPEGVQNVFNKVKEIRQETKARIALRRTCEISNYMSSFAGASWFKHIGRKRITLIGCGGIGSHTAFLLARSGVESLFVVDGDTVEPRNISGQLFRTSDVGMYKVEALGNIIRNLTGFNGLSTMSSYIRVEGQHLNDASQSSMINVSEIPIGDITICGLDSMAVRKEVFEEWKNTTLPLNDKKWFIDGRLSLDTLQIFTFSNKDAYYIEKYEKEYLFSDVAADATTCSTKQTSFMASMIGSFINNIVVAISSLDMGTCYSIDDGDLATLKTTIPFKLEYDSNLFNMIIKR